MTLSVVSFTVPRSLLAPWCSSGWPPSPGHPETETVQHVKRGILTKGQTGPTTRSLHSLIIIADDDEPWDDPLSIRASLRDANGSEPKEKSEAAPVSGVEKNFNCRIHHHLDLLSLQGIHHGAL